MLLIMLNLVTVLVAFASFLIGCGVPIVYAKIILRIRRLRRIDGKSGFFDVIGALAISLSLASVGLVYLSTVSMEARPVTVLAFMIGLGLVRWLRNEL